MHSLASSSSSSVQKSPFAAEQQQHPAENMDSLGIGTGRFSSLDSVVATRDVRMLIGRQAEVEQVRLLKWLNMGML